MVAVLCSRSNGFAACSQRRLGERAGRRPCIITAAPAAATQPSTPASPTGIVGTWQERCPFPTQTNIPKIDLRLVVKISKTDAGALNAVGYSIDQGGQSIPIAPVNFQDGVLKFKITVIDRSYQGKMSEDGKSIAGTWMEATMPLPLTLVRATPETAWEIPAPPPPLSGYQRMLIRRLK